VGRASDLTRRAARRLVDHCRAHAIQLVIVTAGRAADFFGQTVRGAFVGNLKLVEAAPDLDYPSLRQIGLQAATGDVVTFIDDRVEMRDLADLLGPRLPRTAEEPSRTPGLLSVIVPTHDASRSLGAALAALIASDFPRERWELIVVDDASTDDSVLVAARVADRLIRLPGRDPFGPAYARNRGVEFARGENIVFIDADVCVHDDALLRFATTFEESPDIGAVLGSYDAAPADPRLLSQYRNLLYHFFHQRSAGDAHAFWAGCGAVRAAVFCKAGTYDEWRFPRPQIEDIDLGHRILDLGFRIRLRPEIQACHLRCWTMRDMMATDFRDRAIPWMRVMSQRVRPKMGPLLGLRGIETISTALAWLALGFSIAAFALHQLLLGVAAVVAVGLVAYYGRAHLAFFRRERGLVFALVALLLDALYFLMNGAAVVLGWLLREMFGEPSPSPTVEAFFEVGVSTWPPIPSKSER
jgi:glycosyltransferase involved in cell wall biosynthesis